MQEGALTSLSIRDLYRTNTAHEQELTSKTRSHIEYLIPG